MKTTDPFAQLAAQAPRPRDSVLQSIHRDLDKDTKPRRCLSKLQRVMLSASLLALGLVLASAKALVVHPQPLLVAAVALMSVAGLFLAGAMPQGRSLLQLPVRRSLVFMLVAAVFVALVLRAESFLTVGEFILGDGLASTTVCLVHSLMGGVAGTILLMFVWRRSDPFSPSISGALLGCLGGLMGTLSVELLCENGEGWHLTLGHGLPVLALALVSMLVGRRWLAP